MNDEWDYKISGKTNNTPRLIVLFVILAFFTALTVSQIITSKNQFSIVALFFGAIALSSIYLLVKLALIYFCVKVYIGKNGFYFQSNPFDRRYYEYNEIKSCREEMKTSRSSFGNQSSQTAYFYFFYFTDKDGKTHKVQFDKAVYEYEFNVLIERLNKN